MKTRGWLMLMLLSAPSMAAEPARLLSAGSSITELVVALGAQHQLVAVDSTSELPAGSELPRLGYHRQLSAEGMLSTQPSLVIGSEEMGPQTALSLVRQAGVQVEALPEAMTIAQLQLNIIHLGELLDRAPQAQALHEAVQQRAIALRAQPIDSPKRTIFLLLGEGNSVQIAGRHTLADSLIQVAGGMNPASTQVEGYKPVAMEALVAMAPEVILISRRHLTQGADTEQIFQQFPLLSHTPAAQHKAIVAINGKALIGGFGLSTLSEAERLQQDWLAPDNLALHSLTQDPLTPHAQTPE
ncbi:hypothetical protein CBP31_14470 [Oceanisphaera profunda]|uniref:Fe/B12 periplasmic-binding domain-containing protein n=1 Tax=Oceanisphaera profunda TaxID=1416627 RepID=A0A1Y0D811_9GAMM|nr:ABC transporter substrate-binding protein [Oceanisphaera profunda]ART83689.1 hypothetical protein CBP31_14470 [Oceanisphaera profunda]